MMPVDVRNLGKKQLTINSIYLTKVALVPDQV